MRVIAGDLKGRTLKAPTWEGLRPTSDRLRETLFNVLGERVRNARVLDGYAGTGAIGIEALSRGAAHVTFVERDRRALALIEQNLGRCGVTDRYAIIRAAFADAPVRARQAAFDIIILDPPYGSAELTQALEAAGAAVTADTRLVIEHASRDEAPVRSGALVRTRTVRSGDSALSFYRHESSVSDSAC
jgi:16S rRNA (guanine966-N2)-methyltransferase